MKKPFALLTLTALLSLNSALAITLSEALARAPQTSSVKLARIEAQDAQANLTRQLADPLLTRPTEVQARQRAELSQLRLTAAQRSAESSIVSAYTQALEAQKALQIQEKAQDLRELSLSVAQIRQKNGSGTAFDVRDAQNNLEDAKKSVAAARDRLSVALRSLQNTIGAYDNKVVLPQANQLPVPLDPKNIDTVVSRSTSVAQLRQGLESAKLQVSLLDPSYASQSQIDQARLQVENAEENLENLSESERLNIQNLFNTLVDARQNLAVQEAAENNAQDRLETDQKRLKAGLISGLQLLQTELSKLQAELGLIQARNSYLRAYYSFLAGGGSSAGGR